MRRPNSSISNFESRATSSLQIVGQQEFRRRVFKTVCWAVAALCCLDVSIGYLFRPPAEQRSVLTPLQAYFDYGRSVEGKLRRMVGFGTQQSAPIVEAGWLDHDCDRKLEFPPSQLAIEIYGNSFTNGIADEMEKIDPRLSIHRFAGPGASPNHSYACFVQREEKEQAKARIQIVGVLGSSLRRMLTISGLTTSFEQPQPFTYPRFEVGPDERLVSHSASIRSLEDLRAALASDETWRSFLTELAAFDFFFDSKMIEADVADYSVLLRMIRRAWGQRLLRDRTAALSPGTGSHAETEVATVLRAILLDFAKRARSSGQRPIVILIEDRGSGRVLSSMMATTLKQGGIEFIATGELVSTEDPRNFIPDGHFTTAMFAKIASAIVQVVNSER